MKRLVIFTCILFLLFSLGACKKKQAQNQQPVTAGVTSNDEVNNTPKPQPTKADAAATTVPTAAPVSAAITNDLLLQNMMAVDSYYRSIRSVTTEEGQVWEEYDEFAYAKEPFMEYMLLDFRTATTTSETLILGDIYYSRMNDEKWIKSLPGEWFTENTPEFRYELSTQQFPIDYGKLTLTPNGTEKVNGVDCVKYTLSGGYNDEYTDMDIKFIITLSGSGDVWISQDPVIKEVLIRQRVTMNADIKTVDYKDTEGNLIHSSQQVVIEDDVTGINSTSIQPPPDSEIMPIGESFVDPDEVADNIAVAQALTPGTVTQAQAEAWIGKGWEADMGRITFEWVNGYLLGSWVWSDNSKIQTSLSDYLVGTIDGNTLKGDLVYNSEPGQFEFTLDAGGESFQGTCTFDNMEGVFDWNGQASN